MEKRSSFSGSIGFVLAAAGSAVGLGNIWRFPYLAAKDGGGLFLVIYIILALTFGFTLLMTEVSIGRKTKQSCLTAYGKLNKKWGFLGGLASLIPFIILPYYCVIGGWVLKYCLVFITGQGAAAADGEPGASRGPPRATHRSPGDTGRVQQPPRELRPGGPSTHREVPGRR